MIDPDDPVKPRSDINLSFLAAPFALLPGAEAIIVAIAAAVGEFMTDSIVLIVIEHDRAARARPTIFWQLTISNVERRRPRLRWNEAASVTETTLSLAVIESDEVVQVASAASVAEREAGAGGRVIVVTDLEILAGSHFSRLFTQVDRCNEVDYVSAT